MGHRLVAAKTRAVERVIASAGECKSHCVGSSSAASECHWERRAIFEGDAARFSSASRTCEVVKCAPTTDPRRCIDGPRVPERSRDLTARAINRPTAAFVAAISFPIKSPARKHSSECSLFLDDKPPAIACAENRRATTRSESRKASPPASPAGNAWLFRAEQAKKPRKRAPKANCSTTNRLASS